MKQYDFKQIQTFKKKYSKKEWEAREEEYADVIGTLVIPYEPDEKDILAINAAIDQIYSIAKIEQAIYTRLYETLYQKRKNAEATIYLTVKQNAAGAKTTEAELKAQGVAYLQSNNLEGMSASIYDLVNLALERKTFMDSVVDILKTKSDKMITALGATKLSVQIMGNQSAQA